MLEKKQILSLRCLETTKASTRYYFFQREEKAWLRAEARGENTQSDPGGPFRELITSRLDLRTAVSSCCSFLQPSGL